MASAKDTTTFFTHGTHTQYEQVLKLYPAALKLKADRKVKKPEELIKLDNWYQNELPKKIKSRGKDAHMVHDELVQTMKWKQARGKYYPQLSYLIKVNTPRAVIAETKKAFKKLPNLEAAITALSNLKGVGTTMASALLAAASPEMAPFMADECLLAIPDIEGIDYTTKEYLKFVNHISSVADRLNKSNAASTEPHFWTLHKVELALWTHYVVSDLQPELLSTQPATENGNAAVLMAIPPANIIAAHQNGDSLDTNTSEESNQGLLENGKTAHAILADEDTNTSFADNNSTSSPASIDDSSVVSGDSTNDSNYKRPLDEDDSNSIETPNKAKKLRDEQDVGGGDK